VHNAYGVSVAYLAAYIDSEKMCASLQLPTKVTFEASLRVASVTPIL